MSVGCLVHLDKVCFSICRVIGNLPSRWLILVARCAVTSAHGNYMLFSGENSWAGSFNADTVFGCFRQGLKDIYETNWGGR